MKPTKEFIDKVCAELADKGLLIEAGWEGLRLLSIPATASATQVMEMRNAFFCGAQHLFASIIGIVDPGEEPTDQDLHRMDLIDKELQKFIETYKKQHGLQR